MDEPAGPGFQASPGQLDRGADVDLLHVADPGAGMVADRGEVEDRVPGREQGNAGGGIANGEGLDLAAFVAKSPDQVTSQEAGGARDQGSQRSSTPAALRTSRTVPAASRRWTAGESPA